MNTCAKVQEAVIPWKDNPCITEEPNRKERAHSGRMKGKVVNKAVTNAQWFRALTALARKQILFLPHQTGHNHEELQLQGVWYPLTIEVSCMPMVHINSCSHTHI